MTTNCKAVAEEELEELMLHDSSDGERPQSWPLSRVLRGLACGAALVGAAAYAGHHFTAHAASHEDLSGVQQKSDIMNDLWGGANAMPTGFAASQGAAGQFLGSSGSTGALSPSENLNDGNKCEDDEEGLGGLCYKKCSMLTIGERPIRLSAFSCAKSHQLNDVLGAKVGLMFPCHGFDISGDTAGNGCPHKNGACLVDEEISLGKCYEKCHDLTSGQYPYRTGMDTCCKSQSMMECMEPGDTKFSASYNIGGGKGAEAASHAPETKFTEAR